MKGLLGKLRRVDGYLRHFALPDRPEVRFNYVTSQEDAAPRLYDCSGIQVLVARPEMRQSFRDLEIPMSTVIETVFFVLEKDLEAGKTDHLECAQYDRLEEIAEEILELFFRNLESCGLVGGIVVTDFVVRPEVKIFGSWNGYSVAISLS